MGLVESKFCFVVAGSYSDELLNEESFSPSHCFFFLRVSIASKCLDQLWRRLNREPKLKVLYTQFIEEPLSLGHMEKVLNIDEITSDDGFFLPHHGVLRSGNRALP
ncbi:hypothetical protein NPIL_165961 [Nephila pilipes]|uniref:Uncharacterized protein n=1 Tax=Nephila pilipes TaxID=299642 RepID=A0A8X6UTF2_NEPPI|nr:hypothetical protein NPIL_165961 [Nephila pilipes]